MGNALAGRHGYPDRTAVCADPGEVDAVLTWREATGTRTRYYVATACKGGLARIESISEELQAELPLKTIWAHVMED